ncbi:MAG: metallophosphoesterase family protein [Candidatus Tectomicrobia bacterium]|nr:metallophosphoesterase family protein [Candidatus Tectomicrobia bacterium]
MKYAIISDLHGNLEALQAVLDDAAGKVDAVVCLGDIVGYNANPRECLRLVRETCALVVAGNHDQAACGVRPYDDFNDWARQAMDWTRGQLSTEEVEYLRRLPCTAPFGGGWVAAHGSPRHTDEYLFDGRGFMDAFDSLKRLQPEARGCFVGHTHLPMVWAREATGQVSRIEVPPRTVTLDPARRYIVNPGSVGQPRNGNPLAAYAILDESVTVELRNVPYDVAAAQEKIYDAMLPPLLAERLAIGR